MVFTSCRTRAAKPVDSPFSINRLSPASLDRPDSRQQKLFLPFSFLPFHYIASRQWPVCLFSPTAAQSRHIAVHLSPAVLCKPRTAFAASGICRETLPAPALFRSCCLSGISIQIQLHHPATHAVTEKTGKSLG